MALHRTLSLAAILAFVSLLAAPAPAQQTAADLFAHAKADARAEHKNVLAVFSASWCGPCKLYERFLEDPRLAFAPELVALVEDEFGRDLREVGARYA